MEGISQELADEIKERINAVLDEEYDITEDTYKKIASVIQSYVLHEK
jgi:hypothetical protein